MNRFTRYQPRRLPRESYEDAQMRLHGAHAPDEQEAEQAAEFWPAIDRLARLEPLERDGREEGGDA